MFKGILTSPTEELSKCSRFLIFQLRMWRHCLRLLKVNRSGTQAAALSYHTLFGIVPLAIVMLMVFQMFPAYQELGEKVRAFAYEQLHLSKIEYPTDQAAAPDTEQSATEAVQTSFTIADKIDELTESYMAKVHTGAITVVGIVLVIWAALGLLTTIERAFNNIWHVGRGRSFIHRMINYWALITLGPLLLGVGFYASTHYLTVNELQTGLMRYLGPVLPYLISVIAMFFLYFVLPNTRVSAKAALWGAAVAALLWTFAKYGIRIYVARVIPYQAVYGILGIIPLAVFWIYITWLIVLFGLHLTYATQNLKTLDAAELARVRKTDEFFIANDLSVIKIAGCVHDAFENKDQQPVTAGQIAGRLEMPSDFVDKILDHLVGANLLCRTTEPRTGYVPSTDCDNITLADIAGAVSCASFAQDAATTPEKLKNLLTDLEKQLAAHTLKEIFTPVTGTPQTASPPPQPDTTAP